MPTDKPVPDKSGGKKIEKKDEQVVINERSLERDGQLEVSLKAKYDLRHVREQALC